MTAPQPTRVLFVCLGNICRSPLAEGAFIELARRRGVSDRFLADSAGTGHWHIGSLPDHRSRAVARKHGLELTHRARIIAPERDFSGAFDWLIAMDRENRRDLLSLGAPAPRVRLLRSFDPDLAGRSEHELDVPDPYTEGPEAFDEVWRQVLAAGQGLLDWLSRRNPEQ